MPDTNYAEQVLLNNEGTLDSFSSGCNAILESNITSDAPNFEDEYILNTKNLYKIWFNKDPDEFLSKEKQASLTEFRQANPTAKISYIYNSDNLSENAKHEMEVFLNSLCFKGIDFQDIYQKAKNNNKINKSELTILNFAKDELDNFAKGNYGGNPASASDLIRFSTYVQEQFLNVATYSDLSDVEVNFSSLPSFYKINSPIIVPEDNNDFIAIACGNNCQTLHPAAKEIIGKIQSEIISKLSSSKYPEVGKLIKNVYFSNEAELSRIQFRAGILSLDEYDYVAMKLQPGKINFHHPVQNRTSFDPSIEAIRDLNDDELSELYFSAKEERHLLKFSYLRGLPGEYISKFLRNFAKENIDNMDFSFTSEKDIEKMSSRNLPILIDFSYNKLLEEACNTSISKIDENPAQYDCLDTQLQIRFQTLAVITQTKWLKHTTYKREIMETTGPEILCTILKKRDNFSPENSNLAHYILQKTQDAAWQLNNIYS